MLQYYWTGEPLSIADTILREDQIISQSHELEPIYRLLKNSFPIKKILKGNKSLKSKIIT